MSSDQPQIKFNTRERIISTDQQDQQDHIHRSLQEALIFLDGEKQQTGVIQGLVARANGIDLLITVASGLALMQDSAVSFPDSQFRWVEQRSSNTVAIPTPDGANPRWDVIEIEPAITTTLTVPRDIFQPATGGFTTANVAKRTDSTPLLTVRSGTAAASPVLPAGIAKKIPLAYVFVPAGVTSIAIADVMLCRPIIGPPGAIGQEDADVNITFPFEVQGGGIDTVSGATSIKFHECTGRFATSRVLFSTPDIDGGNFQIVANTMDTGALPGAVTLLYFYAIPTPFPAGYDISLAPREFVPGDTTRFAGNVAPGVHNCLIYASEEAPDILLGGEASGVTDNYSRRGNPPAGSFVLADPVWGGITIQKVDAVYLGAAQIEIANSFNAQRSNGFSVYSPDAVLSLLVGNLLVLENGVGNVRFPETARTLYTEIEFLVATTTDAYEISITGGSPERYIERGDYLGATTIKRTLDLVRFVLKDDFTLSVNTLSNLTTPRLLVTGYDDAILARR